MENLKLNKILETHNEFNLLFPSSKLTSSHSAFRQSYPALHRSLTSRTYIKYHQLHLKLLRKCVMNSLKKNEPSKKTKKSKTKNNSKKQKHRSTVLFGWKKLEIISNTVKKLIYKHKNAHRHSKHFQELSNVNKHLKRLCSLEILKCVQLFSNLLNSDRKKKKTSQELFAPSRGTAFLVAAKLASSALQIEEIFSKIFKCTTRWEQLISQGTYVRLSLFVISVMSELFSILQDLQFSIVQLRRTILHCSNSLVNEHNGQKIQIYQKEKRKRNKWNNEKKKKEQEQEQIKISQNIANIFEICNQNSFEQSLKYIKEEKKQWILECFIDNNLQLPPKLPVESFELVPNQERVKIHQKKTHNGSFNEIKNKNEKVDKNGNQGLNRKNNNNNKNVNNINAINKNANNRNNEHKIASWNKLDSKKGGSKKSKETTVSLSFSNFDLNNFLPKNTNSLDQITKKRRNNKTNKLPQLKKNTLFQFDDDNDNDNNNEKEKKIKKKKKKKKNQKRKKQKSKKAKDEIDEIFNMF
ncbi:nucleolus and neural progenitor protein [Anaeramoeba flamelloides]|uniref:Nucleolus and neural progenitor protein n=1 Tax=Anaeramoeba flamelloides TaxID=1746091 RepID=A0AAV7YVZ8_9EUKA|nr:nucleolus and neural progenitor protein [Anaeramoeba flamelloides]